MLLSQNKLSGLHEGHKQLEYLGELLVLGVLRYPQAFPGSPLYPQYSPKMIDSTTRNQDGKKIILSEDEFMIMATDRGQTDSVTSVVLEVAN